MNTNLKKILLIFGGGYIIYWAFNKLKPIGGKSKSSKSSASSAASEASFSGNDEKKNAMMVLRAYKMAKKNGESRDFLNELNVETAKEFGMKVMTEKSSGKCFVVDLNGNKIL